MINPNKRGNEVFEHPIGSYLSKQARNEVFEHPIGSYLSKQARNEVFEHPRWIVICRMGMLENFVSSLVWIDHVINYF